jgi:TPR repeat protein
VKWFRRAADQGYAVAQNELGVMYAKGRGVSKDMEEAAHWCRLAAVQGSKVARKNLRLTQVANVKVMRQLTTATSKQTYPMATLQQVAADGVVVSFVPVPGGFGLARVKLEELPSDLRQICNYATKEPVASESAYSQIGSMATQL